MLKLFKYLKASIFSILIIIILLICQANLDLALPDYTSKIINVGIQQNGIENSIASVISESTFNEISILLNNEDKKILEENYNLIKKGDSKYLDKYPILKQENIYKLNIKDKEKLNETLEKAFAIFYVGDMLSKVENSEFKLPEGMTLTQTLKVMDENTRLITINKIEEKIKDMPDTILSSSAIEFIKKEYE